MSAACLRLNAPNPQTLDLRALHPSERLDSGHCCALAELVSQPLLSKDGSQGQQNLALTVLSLVCQNIGAIGMF